MDENPPPAAAADPSASSLFDWSEFLNFNIDDSLGISFPPPEQDQSGVDQSQRQGSPGRVRKRDPRLVCSNFLAGRIPCACPELDEKLDEEEDAEPGLPGKKRNRTGRAPAGNPIRCQVPGCEADISELKGYHRRHRVCLRCATAGSVALGGESKRYCQQCGKFHVLSDFDEGRRSCRRKLERHNKRRRRKPDESQKDLGKGAQQVVLVDDISGDDTAEKDGASLSSQVEERETLLDSDGHISTLCSMPGSQNVQTDSIVSFSAAIAETHTDGDNQNPESKSSPLYLDNKSTFSSVCPTGRISFKLYDWNPAEFPRRLRHQIFEWLASMPVELEGYIRPGCTILTAFIAMPKPVWRKLLEEPTLYIKDLVSAPGSMLSGRGTMSVYLNEMIFRVTKDANSVVRTRTRSAAPKLHYIYPTFFEAGKPMEFVACGNHLLQPNFRFLISFSGRYLVYNIRVSSICCEKGGADSIDHQLLKIFVPGIDIDVRGPAFIEVENQSGLSNFIPILVGDKETCMEMEVLQRRFEKHVSPQEHTPSPLQPKCEVFAFRQSQFSEFILDVAWLLRKPTSKQHLTSIHIQRFNNLLNFLIENESRVILERVTSCLNYYMDNSSIADISDSEMGLFRRSMDIAQQRLAQKLLDEDVSIMPTDDRNFCRKSSCSPDTMQSVVPATKQKMTPKPSSPLPPLDESIRTPLLKGDVIMNVELHNKPGKICGPLLTRSILTSRSIIIMGIAAIGVCFGICAIVIHPQRVGQIATSIHRCLFYKA
ncbi:squamosa promoter-binding-like protein 7 [Andrographis paniculata]|uniref:squamosa promoter-binding-like protein 7 n=1 Tax=Andrographis paniculata TaxID=175694 RepID=UPI0021E77AAD|nr:squamosa promoter-binding-like protein 7 [Andrographis paniculata]